MYKKSEKIRLVIADIRLGKKLYQAVESAKISLSLWYLWEKKVHRLLNLRKAAEEKCEEKRTGMVTDAFFKNAIGGNVSAQIFYLKNRGWKDNPLVDQSIHQHYTIIRNSKAEDEDRSFIRKTQSTELSTR